MFFVFSAYPCYPCSFQMAYLDSLSLEQILLQGIQEWKTARPDSSVDEKDVFEDAKNVAPSLLKLNRKHF